MNTLESTSFNGFWPNLVHAESGTLLIFKVICLRSRSPSQIFRRGDTPRFALPLFILLMSTIIVYPFIVDHSCLSFYCWPFLFIFSLSTIIVYSFIRSPCQRQCELLTSLVERRLLSVSFSHFNLLLWNPLGNDHLAWKKIFWFPMLLKKIFWFWWRKKKKSFVIQPNVEFW